MESALQNGNNTFDQNDTAARPSSTSSNQTTSAASKVRRRNRMITSCLECRRRKLRCDKLQPCTNCTKFSRDCVFLAPALDSVSQQKLNEIKEKMGSLEQVLERDVARKGQSKKNSNTERRSSVDLPGDESSSDDENRVPDDEKGLEPTPLAVVDGAWEDDVDDDILDLGIRIGRMRMTERLGGFFRPKMAEELGHTLARGEIKGEDERESAGVNSGKEQFLPPLTDNADDFLEPGPSYIAPGSGFVFGDVGDRKNIIDFLPTKGVADMLVTKYHENVHFVARVLHWPSFQLLYENFWTSMLGGVEPPASQQAIVMAVMFSAVASMPESDVISLFGRQKRLVLMNLQKGTEVSLSKARFLRTTKMETMQALVMYLIPMCRDQMSRAHSVLVGTAIRLAECMGLHRDPLDVYGLPPVESQVRRMIWFQLCFLDFRTGETQGPRPCIKREDYDTKFPLNVDDLELMSGKVQESTTLWTDMTLSRLRFECTEMHRIIWYDRIRLEKRKVSLTHVLGKVESFRKAMEAKYTPIIDTKIPIQMLGHLVLQILLLRMHIMVLHRYHNNESIVMPARLRQVMLESGTAQLEAAVKIETIPELQKWRWYSGAFQQWHTAFLLLTEVFSYPKRKEADRIWNVVDFVFEPDPSLTREQRARTIIGAGRDRTAVYRDLRRIRAPVSMQEYAPPTAKRYPQASHANKDTIENDAFGSSGMKQRLSNATAIPNPASNTAYNTVAANEQWSFDTPSTYLVKADYNVGQMPGVDQKQQSIYDTSVYNPQAQSQTLLQPPQNSTSLSQHNTPSSLPLLDFSSPSDNSAVNESWPPFISNNQGGWQMIQQARGSSNATPQSYPMSSSLMDNSQLMNSLQDQSQNQFGQVTRTNMNNGYTSTISAHGEFNPPMPIMPGAMPIDSSDSVMLDIDWREWDKIFPPDQNTGNLDISPSN